MPPPPPPPPPPRPPPPGWIESEPGPSPPPLLVAGEAAAGDGAMLGPAAGLLLVVGLVAAQLLATGKVGALRDRLWAPGGAARGIALRLARPDEVDAHPDNPFPLAVEQADAGHTPHDGAPGWRSLK